MKATSTTAVLCAASLLAMAPAALAQPSQQPASPGSRAGMMQPPTPEMMQTMMQMMQIMHSGSSPRMAMMGGSLFGTAAAIQNVEGHLAFLKAELKITDAQQKSWDQFAEVLRTNANQLNAAARTTVGGIMPGMMGGMMQGMQGMMGGADKRMPLAARLEQREKMLALHLEVLRRSRAALEGLNAVLSDEQKRLLEELM